MWIDPLKREWDKHPLTVIALTAFSANAASRLLNAITSAKSRRAYAKQINSRVKS